MKVRGELRTTAAATEVDLVEGVPAKRIQLLRIGANPARDRAKVYTVRDRAHAEAIVAASNAYAGSTEPMIDYDHQSVYGARDGVGGRAEAAGWMKALLATDEGIFADVEWTSAASEALGDKRYRYISPYFGHDASGTVTRVFNAALTNRPELELRAVASQTFGDPMDEIAIALGLAAGASIADILAAIKTMTTTTASATAERVAVCSALGLAAGAGLDEIRTAASARGAVDPTKFVPMAEFTSLRARVEVGEETRVTASVDDAIRGGKIAPASRDWALGYAKADPAGFTAFLGVQPEIVGQGPEERRAAAIKADVLTDEERSVCSQMGIKPEDYLASRKELAK